MPSNSPGLWPKGVSDLLSAGLFVKLSFDIVSPGSQGPRQRPRRAHVAPALVSPVGRRGPWDASGTLLLALQKGTKRPLNPLKLTKNVMCRSKT